MKKILLSNLLLIAAILLFSSHSNYAQNSVGFNIGLSSYEGDLHCFEDPELNFLKSAGVSFGIQGRKELGKYFAGRVAYQFASFRGDDNDFSIESGHPSRNFSFTNNVHELTLKLDLEPFKHKVASPFISIGAGIGLGNPNTDYSTNTNSSARQTLVDRDKDEISNSFFALPLSAGINFRVSELVTIGTEFGVRLSSGDYLDGVSFSGSDEFNDYFGTAVISLNYAIGGIRPRSLSTDSQQNRVKKESQQIAKDTQRGTDPGEITPPRKIEENLPPPPPPPVIKKEIPVQQNVPENTIVREEESVVEPAVKTIDSDLDGDGYADRVDNCPRVYSLTNNGCPENVVNSDVDCGASFGMNSVKFQTSIADLSIEDKETLNSVIAILTACPDLKVRIEGHTDSRGKDYVNQALSETRAKSVKGYIMRSGINSSRIRTVGYGENQPIATNDSDLGRALNRRVEISLF